MTKQFVKEAPYHPGYEDAVFQDVSSPIMAELTRLRKDRDRSLKFSEAIVNYCSSAENQMPTR
ncbi:hypothetical protein [Polynucleobacter antarcticus]|uniref:Uncharacterized protein n=1 Tax=Polynucleobacter antarcticus TaxID=1743162 RepID=A0A6M9PLS3_9BURK|nr:hypothetical protein [Polynucleobacter antarcticus]QKM63184.1 hypothetical protein DCO16_09065 [Polynucleobacter antarcticus]